MKELRKLIALKLFDWSMEIMPNCKFKDEINQVILNNIIDGLD
tara:strand:- start:275 stop:403 length:129 start_codon:yes stop_codon:yes gene_type:complete